MHLIIYLLVSTHDEDVHSSPANTTDAWLRSGPGGKIIRADRERGARGFRMRWALGMDPVSKSLSTPPTM